LRTEALAGSVGVRIPSGMARGRFLSIHRQSCQTSADLTAMKRIPLVLLTVVLLSACGKKQDARSPKDATATENAGRVEPTTESERAILHNLDDLPSGTARSIGGERVTALAPYVSASGLRCRRVAWAKQERLACREPEGWYFVPDVFGTAGPP